MLSNRPRRERVSFGLCETLGNEYLRCVSECALLREILRALLQNCDLQMGQILAVPLPALDRPDAEHLPSDSVDPADAAQPPVYKSHE